MGRKAEMIQAIEVELVMRKEELKGQEVACIYFGGGTPSILESQEIERILDTIQNNYSINKSPEITLEANPDDLNVEKVRSLTESPINRLSIGVQSFFGEDLKLMNRAHNAQDALACIQLVKHYFENYSLDLIYGMPGMSNDRWKANVQQALDLDVPHLSAYALTVESKTALAHFVQKGIIKPLDDDQAQTHHSILCDMTETAGYENYEFSNFGKPNYHSRNNMAYWEGKSYIGIGPGAHSYDGKRRAWNVSNNPKYIKSIQEEKLPQEIEVLSLNDHYNEHVMTRLRTQKGISLGEINQLFGEKFKQYLLDQAQDHFKNELLLIENNQITVTRKGKFLTDGIAADLFLVNLS